jgi:hypothetical protein
MLATIVSVVQFNVDRLDRQESRREQLLALCSVRRDLESGPSHKGAGPAVAMMRRDVRKSEG